MRPSVLITVAHSSSSSSVLLRLSSSATLATNSRVQWLALLESVLVISLMVFQIHYIRKWFQQTDSRGRV
jgi:uncharacterized membrane protein